MDKYLIRPRLKKPRLFRQVICSPLLSQLFIHSSVNMASSLNMRICGYTVTVSGLSALQACLLSSPWMSRVIVSCRGEVCGAQYPSRKPDEVLSHPDEWNGAAESLCVTKQRKTHPFSIVLEPSAVRLSCNEFGHDNWKYPKPGVKGWLSPLEWNEWMCP